MSRGQLTLKLIQLWSPSLSIETLSKAVGKVRITCPSVFVKFADVAYFNCNYLRWLSLSTPALSVGFPFTLGATGVAVSTTEVKLGGN